MGMGHPSTPSFGMKPTSKTVCPATAAPARLLNELLQACYEVETCIYSSIPTPDHQLLSSRDTDPLAYLTSCVHLARWETGLASLGQEYLRGVFTPQQFENVLSVLLVGVERLEKAKEMMERNFEAELEKCGIEFTVPEAFWGVLEERCRILESAFVELGEKLDEVNSWQG